MLPPRLTQPYHSTNWTSHTRSKSSAARIRCVTAMQQSSRTKGLSQRVRQDRNGRWRLAHARAVDAVMEGIASHGLSQGLGHSYDE